MSHATREKLALIAIKHLWAWPCSKPQAVSVGAIKPRPLQRSLSLYPAPHTAQAFKVSHSTRCQSSLHAGGFGSAPLNTLDEPVWATVRRDLKRIGDNLVLVVFPFRSRDQQSAALRNWDLWGPMVGTPPFCALLQSAQTRLSTSSLL